MPFVWSTQDVIECLFHGFGPGGINHNTVKYLPTYCHDLIDQFVDCFHLIFLLVVWVV